MPADLVTTFMFNVLDSDQEISIEYLKRKNWDARVVARYMNPMLAEWLVNEVINIEGGLLGLSYEYKNPAAMHKLEKNIASLMKFYTDTSHFYSIVTNEAEDFVVYKDEANRFLILLGGQEFLSRTYRCSAEAAEKMFSWEVDGDLEEDDMRRVWKKYMGKELNQKII